ncbi:MAG: hypothetical protein R3244_10635, partial [Thermoanaerobaculia bacterium]|nr:hypothetical protein [Thermoanaerobaculia bacterium]
RTSSFAMKGKDLTVQQIAQDLHVDTVLEGAVRRAGDRLRITTQLVHAADGYPLWSERYDREMADVFDLQDEIAGTITETLEVRLGGRPDEPLRQGGTRNVDAYQEYLRGRFHWNRRDGTGLKSAMMHFQNAIQADPTYALAYAGLADAYNILAFYNYVPPADGFPRAEAAAKRALEIDGRLAEAHTSLGWIAAFHEWDWTKAEQIYLEAIRLNASYGTAHLWYCFLLGLLGRRRESREQLAIAQRLEPLSIITKGGASWLMLHTRDFERGAREAKETLALEPEFGPAWAFLGWHRVLGGRFEEAIEAWSKAVERLGGLSLAKSMLGYAHARAGNDAQAEQLYDALVESATEEYVTPYYAAAFALALGRREEAFEWLERGLEERNSFMPFLGVDPLFDDLRDDDRFAGVLDTVGLPEIEIGS